MKKEELIKFYQLYKLYIFPSVVALSSLFLIIFAIYPQTMKLIDNEKVAQEFTTRTEFLEKKATALEGYEEEDLSRKLKLVLSAFPPERDFGGVMGLLQQLVAGSGYNITSISLGSSSKKTGTSESFEVELSIKGPRLLFQTLLNNLENSPRLVKINTIDITSTSSSQTIDAFVSLDILYASLPNSFGNVDSPVPVISEKDEEIISSLSQANRAVRDLSSGPLSPRGKVNPFE